MKQETTKGFVVFKLPESQKEIEMTRVTWEESIRAACDEVGLRSDVAVLRERAMDIAFAEVGNRVCMFLNVPLSKCSDIEDDVFDRLVQKFIPVGGGDHNCLPSYGLTIKVRKQYQKELNRVYDCRTYCGQPARDMRY